MSLDLEMPKKFKENWHDILNGNFQKIKDYADENSATMADKVNGKWRVYHPDELNLSEDDTIETVIKRMAERSIVDIHTTNSDTVPLGLMQLAPQGLTDQEKTGRVQIHRYNVNRCTVFYYHFAHARMWIGTYYNDFSGWKELATKDSPTKRALPMASGISPITTDSCYYYKTQNNTVKVVGCIQKTSALINGNLLATLPAGYRPAIAEDRVAMYATSYAAGLVRVATNGQITVNFSGISSQTQVFFELEFEAA